MCRNSINHVFAILLSQGHMHVNHLRTLYLKQFVFHKIPTFYHSITGWGSLLPDRSGSWSRGWSKYWIVFLPGQCSCCIIVSSHFPPEYYFSFDPPFSGGFVLKLSEEYPHVMYLFANMRAVFSAFFL